MKKTFKEWMKEVDQILSSKYGFCVNDIPDVCYRDMYDSGNSPKTAADVAWRNAFDEF